MNSWNYFGGLEMGQGLFFFIFEYGTSHPIVCSLLLCCSLDNFVLLSSPHIWPNRWQSLYSPASLWVLSFPFLIHFVLPLLCWLIQLPQIILYWIQEGAYTVALSSYWIKIWFVFYLNVFARHCGWRMSVAFSFKLMFFFQSYWLNCWDKNEVLFPAKMFHRHLASGWTGWPSWWICSLFGLWWWLSSFFFVVDLPCILYTVISFSRSYVEELW